MEDKELGDIFLAVGKLVKAGMDSGSDGKFDLADISRLLGTVPSIIQAIDGYEKLPDALNALTPERVAAHGVRLAAELALDDVKAQAVLGGSMKVLAGAVEIVQGFRKAA